ncbi:hypothetical protein H9P43_009765 [Blastocladiella emersonii ATCC 22665]|nr:hypothetical protein H9P43_009765 [Blastocladiella emersonii ATCC 22665]
MTIPLVATNASTFASSRNQPGEILAVLKPYPAAELLAFLATAPDQVAIARIREVVRKYKAGADAHAVAKLDRLIRQFHASESPFMLGGDAVRAKK